MSNIENNENMGGRQSAAGPAIAPMPEACGANELKGLLNQIADRLADSDRRQGQMLSAMQDRLVALGSEARTVRNRVPAEFVPAFERVEEGMALLADKIAGAVTAMKAAASDELPPHDVVRPGTPMVEPAPVVPAHVIMRAVVKPAAPALAVSSPPAATAAAQPAPPDAAPAALRSAAGDKTGGAKTAAQAAPSIDPFDMVERVVPETEHTWDNDQAEALARVYEGPEAGFKLSAEAPAAAAVAEPRLAPHADEAEVAGIGRDWLEDRFADIAQRVEQSLQHNRPDTGLQALGRRFDQFEARFGSVLDNVATRQDVEGLRLVEAHITELAAQFEHAQAQLGRLDGIETQINVVAERLADTAHASSPADIAALVSEAADRAMQRVAAFREPAPDLNRVATAAAEAAVTRYSEAVRAAPAPAAAPATAAGPDKGVADLHDMIASFMNERRSGDENTATMLDTMQQAMIRVLDRIDAMEMSQAPQQMSAAPQEYVREQVRFGSAPAEQRPIHEDVRNAMNAAAAAAAQMPQSGGSPFSHVPSSDVPPGARMSSLDAGRVEQPRAPQAPVRATSERSKDDFVAAARRARRQVAAMPADAPAAAAAQPEAAAGPVPTLKPAAPDRQAGAKAKEKEKESGGLSFFGIQRKKFLGGAVAVIAIMVASLLMPPKHVELAGNATPFETTVPAAVAVADAPAALGEAGETAPVASAEAPSAPTGITLQVGSTPPTLAQLETMDHQRAMATLSSQLGEAAAGTPPATPISLTPVAPAPDAADDAPLSAEGPQAGRAQHELPPATVGPLSLRISAAKGDPSAQFEVGARLAEGKGTQQNFPEAIKWYQRSAQQGFAQAQYRLGTLYERGLGAKTDLGRARVWYKRAAEQGNIKAMHNLAVLSAGRQTGTPDYATAAHWFSEAADRGLVDSQFNLAVLYESGLGVPKDLKQAFKWFSIAARKGDAQTVKRREAIRSKLTASEMDAAETLLRDWSTKPQDLLANDARAAGEAWKQPAQQQPAPAVPTEG